MCTHEAIPYAPLYLCEMAWVWAGVSVGSPCHWVPSAREDLLEVTASFTLIMRYLEPYTFRAVLMWESTACAHVQGGPLQAKKAWLGGHPAEHRTVAPTHQVPAGLPACRPVL